jgi:Domain of unknown function (DUF3850)
VKVHKLKTWPRFYQQVAIGYKQFEVRRDDRGFQVGDILILEECDEKNGYSGAAVAFEVSYLMRGGMFGLKKGFVAMSLGKRHAVMDLAKGAT